MTRFLRLSALVVSLASLGFVAGCRQGVGERCQTQDDCDDTLLCVLPSGDPRNGGTCEPPSSLVSDGGSTAADLAAPSDAAPTQHDMSPGDGG